MFVLQSHRILHKNWACPCAGPTWSPHLPPLPPCPQKLPVALQDRALSGSKSLHKQQTKRFQFSVTGATLLFHGSFSFRGMFMWSLPWSPVGGVFLLEISQIHCTFIYFKSFSLQLSSGIHSWSSYFYPQTRGSGWHGASSAISQKYFYTENSHRPGRNCSGFKHQMRRPHKNYTESDFFLSMIQFGWRKFSAFYINQQNSHSIETFNLKV